MVKYLEQIITAYHLVRLIQQERGPWAMFERMRALPDKLPAKFGLAEEVRQAMACKYCLSAYAAMAAVVLPPRVTRWLAVWGTVVWLYDSTPVLINYLGTFLTIFSQYVSVLVHALQNTMRPSVNQTWSAPKMAASPTPTPTQTSGR